MKPKRFELSIKIGTNGTYNFYKKYTTKASANRAFKNIKGKCKSKHVCGKVIDKKINATYLFM